MAILNLFGFEIGGNDDFAAVVGTQAVVTTTVRTGTYAFRCNPTTTATGAGAIQGYSAQGAALAITQNQHTLRFYFNYNVKPASGDEEIIHFARNDNTTKASVRINSSGNLAVYDGTPALVATGSTVLNADTWYRIEFQVVYGTSGTYELRINGATELSGTINTDVSIANAPQRVYLGKSINRNGNSVTYYFDDVVLRGDTTWPGEGEAKIMLPNANGGQMDWVNGTDLSDYNEVNDVPRTVGDYIESTGTAGDIALFDMDDTATVGISGTINALKLLVAAWEAVSTTSSNVIRIKSGASNQNSTARNLGTGTSGESQMISETDPATGVAWTTAGLDAVRCGVLENNAVVMRCSAVYLQVDYTPSAVASTFTPKVIMM